MDDSDEHSTIERLDQVLARTERITRLQLFIVALTASAVLWGARLEWTLSDHEKRLSRLEEHSDEMRMDVRDLKARMPGLMSAAPLPNLKRVKELE